MPSGPAVVGCLGVALVLAVLLHYVAIADRKGDALLRLLAALAAVIVIVVGTWVLVTGGPFRQIHHEHEWEQSHGGGATNTTHDLDTEPDHACDEGDTACIAARFTEQPEWPALASEQLTSDDPEERESAVELLSHIDDRRSLDLLARAASVEPDGLLRLKQAGVLAERGDKRGLSIAAGLLGPDYPVLVRDDAFQWLVERSGEDFGYDPFAPAEDNAAAIEKWREWIGAH
jgi:hypothetical protein